MNPGERITELRKAAGLSRERLAAKAGCSQATVVRVEKGREATVETWQKLAAALGVPLTEILES